MIKKYLVALLIVISSLSAGDLLELSFNDYIRFVSSETSSNFVLDEKINKKFSIFLPADYKSIDHLILLKSILKQNKFYLENVGSINYIKKLEIEKRFYAIKTRFMLPSLMLPILRKNFPDIKFASVKRRIIFNCNSKDFKSVSSLIDLIDVPVRQRKIKITLMYYSNSDLKDFGLKIASETKESDFSTKYISFIKDLTINQTFSFASDTLNIALFLTDLEERSLVDYKFTPIVSISNDKDTVFNIVKNIPYLQANTSVNGNNDIANNSYEYKDVGTQIKLTDVTITDDAVYFKLDLKYELILDDSITPKTSKRSVSNYIKLSNGQSMLLSGIKSSEIINSVHEVPLLSWIPYLGELFKYKSDKDEKETFAIYIENIDNGFFNSGVSASQKGFPIYREMEAR